MKIFRNFALEEAAIGGGDTVDIPKLDVIEEDDIQIQEQADAIEAGCCAMEEGVTEIQDQQEVIGTVAETLPEADGGTAQDGEGLSPDAAEVVEASMERFARKFNLKYTRVLPAKEAIGSSKGTRKQVAKIAIEAMAVAMEGALDRLSKAGKWILFKMVDITDRMITRVNNFRRAFEVIKQKYGASGVKFGAVDFATIAKALSRNGTASSKTTVDVLRDSISIMDASDDAAMLVRDVVEGQINYSIITNVTKRDEFVKKCYNRLTAIGDKLKEARFVGDWTYVFEKDDKRARVELDKNTVSNHAEKLDILDSKRVVEIANAGLAVCKRLEAFKDRVSLFQKTIDVISKPFDWWGDSTLGVKVRDYLASDSWGAFIGNYYSVRYVGGIIYSRAMSNATKAMRYAIRYIEASAKAGN